MLRFSLAAVVVSLYLRSLLERMPHPFEGLHAVDYTPEAAQHLPGNTNGSVLPPTFEGPLELNQRLHSAEILFKGEIIGSESVAIGGGGDLIMIDRQGFVHRATQTGNKYALSTRAPVYVGPGRPLGFHVHVDAATGETLYICDSLKGLLRVQLSGEGAPRLEVLSNAIHVADDAPPLPFNYANDLDVASDGTVFFTSSTDGPVGRNVNEFYDTMHSYLLSTLRGKMTGRLLKYDPRSRRTTVLLSGLNYANGVALSADETWVAVAETNTARVLRHYLRGPRAGETDVLIDRLPALPDGLSRSPRGGIWIALIVKVSPLMRGVAPYRRMRQLLSHVVGALVPYVVRPWAGTIRIDESGAVVDAMYDPDGRHIQTLTAVTEHDGRLFFGNLGGDYVSVLQL